MEHLKQGSMNTYTISQYKNGIHRAHESIRVKAASGKVFSINKYINNVGEAWFQLFESTTDNVSRASKQLAINYLKNH